MVVEGDEKAGLPILQFANQAEWEDWLERHGATSKGVWLKIAKKGAGVTTPDYPQSLEGALVHGWIDGQKAPLDKHFWLQRFSPRQRKSRWSEINRGKVVELERQ